MNTVTRGMRNAFRNSIRTFSIVVILGLSVGLALAMLVARQAVQQKIESVKTSIGNTITISPAGTRGFEGGGEPLTNDQVNQLASISNVTQVTQTLSDRLTTANTNLVSAINPGSLGERHAGNSGVGFEAAPEGDHGGSAAPQINRTFTPPVIVTGTNDSTSTSVFGGNTVTFVSGQTLDVTKDADEAIVGKALAEKNSLSVGSTFTAYGKPIKVVGIYDSGNTFSNGGLITPLLALQRLSGQSASVTNAVVTVNSIDDIDAVVSAIKTKLADKADVVSNQDTAKQAIAPLENVKSISLFSLIGALIAGAVIILLTMMMIVRERRREIGVMKAIGASNLKTMFQFASEAVTLTVLGLIVGLVIGVAAANPITNILVRNSTSSSSQTAQTSGQTAEGGGHAGGRGGFRGAANSSLTSIQNIRASVGWDILGYGVGAALLIAIVGSAIPAYLISKVRPAEVMRTE